MKSTIFKSLVVWCLMCMFTLGAQAQDVPIRRPNPKPKPTTGTLSITSTPSGAVVKIDGKYMGETPLTLEKQKPVTYCVTFSAEGYESQTKEVTVKAGKIITCKVTLQKHSIVITESDINNETSMKVDIFYPDRVTDITDNVKSKLTKLIEFLESYPDTKVYVTGYTSANGGNPKINLKYSQVRAEIVANALIEAGVNSTRITVDAKGDTVQPYMEDDKNNVTIIIAK